jgi:hypothetical protein
MMNGAPPTERYKETKAKLLIKQLHKQKAQAIHQRYYKYSFGCLVFIGVDENSKQGYVAYQAPHAKKCNEPVLFPENI